MQGLADGYFVLPNTIADYLARGGYEAVAADHPACKAVQDEARDRLKRLLGAAGKRTADSFHRELGRIVWDGCGMSRNEAGLKQAIGRIAELREVYWRDVKVTGSGDDLNPALEAANRIGDFFELGELMCRDALERNESCGAHFREEHVTDEGEAKRDDEHFSHVSVWEWAGEGEPHRLYLEPLEFENVQLAQRSYK
jgi:succinate dehydrogenase / fumarate reductase flavoprotein subunit